jgi:murein DD-endopeptidase MepM/ murein hydrolase activator NlpD
VRISTILEQLRNIKTTTVIPVVFVLASLLASTAIQSKAYQTPQGSLGGPYVEQETSTRGQTFVNATTRPTDALAAPVVVIEGISEKDASLTGFQGIFAGTIARRENLLEYTIKKGDTLSEIAWEYGVSLDTLTYANPNISASRMGVGQKILIPPTTGILHTVQNSETLADIAGMYGIPLDTLESANKNLSGKPILSGAQVVVPGGRPIKQASSATSRWPNLRGYFTPPATGRNWGRVHNYNAIDIANSCGTPIAAAAEGLVTELGVGWNGGYGKSVKIQHPNGTFTLYAHLQETSVTEGDYVEKGGQVGEMGNTGNTHGPTGCHLHYEVHNAQNPLAQ